MQNSYTFDAFISYSHRDLTWARWLQRSLENHRLPAAIRRESSIGHRHLRIFRDQTDLAGIELREAIQKELRASRYLIVLCSPRSAASPWVAAEIAYFKQLGRGDHILPFIIDGEPETDRTELECFSPELRNVDDVHYLGANVQELGRSKALLRVMSILLDVRFDRLVDRDRRHRLLRRSIIGSVAAAVALVTGTLLWRNLRTENEKRMLLYGNAVTVYAQSNEVTGEMIDMLRLSADAGEEQACLLLGDFYQNGKGVEPDPNEAFRQYRSAASAGSADGLVALGNCYTNGVGVECDAAEAFRCFSRAAELESAPGLFATALCYRDGLGVEADPCEAFRLYLRAADMGHPLAMKAVAYCYLSGEGTEPDPEGAFAWTKRLAETGDPESMYNLAIMYQRGYGTEAATESALEWYRRAAATGDADAMYMVGWCIENHIGISDPALYWYRLAEANGNSSAAADIARLTAAAGDE